MESIDTKVVRRKIFLAGTIALKMYALAAYGRLWHSNALRRHLILGLALFSALLRPSFERLRYLDGERFKLTR